jgi:4-aminobutyrate aminotransferase
MGNRLMQNLVPLSEELAVIGEIRGKGLMIGVELVRSDGAPAPELASAVLEAAREEGLLIGKGGLYGNSLRLAPPMSITEEEADEGFARLERALRRSE